MNAYVDTRRSALQQELTTVHGQLASAKAAVEQLTSRRDMLQGALLECEDMRRELEKTATPPTAPEVAIPPQE